MPSTAGRKTSPPRESPITIAGRTIGERERIRLEVPVSRLATETWLSLPLEVVSGRQPGPRLWLSAAVHGDELNGVEIIRQILSRVDPEAMKGTLIAVPIVNVFGFLEQSRYLPDRRDLNRSFPGSRSGSLASRVANLFMTEVVAHCDYGIDLHTGSNHRTNLPQVRANLHDDETRTIAEAFGAPVRMHSETRDGSLREAASRRAVHTLLYEAGEALRFDPDAIRVGVTGVLRVMHALRMRKTRPKLKSKQPVEVTDATWVRARRGGLTRLDVALGDRVARKQRIGVIADAFGDNVVDITAPHAGIVLGHSNNPLVNQGDGVVHVGRVRE